jgi:hypothetical protein
MRNHFDHVRILLDGSRFTKVRKHGILVSALLRTAVQLAHRDHRHLQLLRQKLELTGEFGDLLLARLDFLPDVISCR